MDLDANYHYWAQCPCRDQIAWDNGEPYEEPTQDDRERLAKMLFDSMPQSSIGRYDLAADYLIANGVTFENEEFSSNQK